MVLAILTTANAEPLATSFTYQGELLVSGAPANGDYDFEFVLHDALNAGAVVGAPVAVEDATVTDGVFSVELDFGAMPFAGDQLWLEIKARDGASTGDYTGLVPRQKLTAAPYALHAESVADGSIGNQEIDSAQVQQRVSDFCPSGSSIRAVASNGTVTCHTDEEGPWLTNSISAPFVTGVTRVGIGTSAPAAALQIDAPLDTDPFRARVQSSTKLRVHTNGSVSVGTSSAGPENGLYVFGQTGLGTTSPGARLSLADSNWQFSLENNDTGGSEWFMGSSSDAWQTGGGKFVVSPTNSSGNAALTIDANKAVGIGTFSPESRLHVAGGSDVTPAGGGFITIGNTTSTHIAMDNNEIMGRNNGAAAQLAINAEGGLVTINSGGNVNDDSMDITGSLRIDSGQNSGIIIGRTTSNPTNSVLYPTIFEEGLVGFSGAPFWRMYSREFYARTALDYKTYSDQSIKKNILPISDALDTVLALQGVTYALDKHPFGQKKNASDEDIFRDQNQIGFIAQEVEQVLPQLVSMDETSGLRAVAYMGLIPILVAAIAEQQLQIEKQNEKIESLQHTLESIR